MFKKILTISALSATYLLASTCLVHAQEAPTYPYQQVFTITAYYSPIEGQQKYVKGSLEKDKKLNGNGTHGADGTPVFPGMIAAPKTIPFDTKMSIPGIGTVAVHDRGGAIVPAGQRGEKFDRLDIWMGHGDQGLNRALAWGRRNVTVTVYGPDASKVEQIDLSALDQLAQKLESTNTTIASSLFPRDLGSGSQGDQVTALQKALSQLGYFQGELTGNFGDLTQAAVLKFQLAYEIVDDANDFGAGYFGPQTRKKLEAALNGLTANQNHQKNIVPQQLLTPIGEITVAQAAPVDQQTLKIELAGNGLSFLDTDLKVGDSGQAVIELQTELRKLNLFGIEPTGFYGELTAHAVMKFQQTQGLVNDQHSFGAGQWGPQTRGKLADLVKQRIDLRSQIAQRSSDNLLALQ